MKLRNLIKGFTNGSNLEFHINKVNEVELLPKKQEEDLFLDIHQIDKALSVVIGQIKTDLQEDEEIEVGGFLKLSARKNYSQIPNLQMSFNGVELSNWAFAARKTYHLDFQFRYSASKSLTASLDKNWGRSALLVANLAERGCSLIFPCLMVLNDQTYENRAAAKIYAPIPKFEILKDELKRRRII